MRTRLLGALFAVLLIAQPAFAQVMKLHPAIPVTSNFKPSDLGAKVPFWFGAQYASTVHNSPVTQWDNQGALSGSLTIPPAVSTAPTLLTAALNGKNAIRGDGANPGSGLSMSGVSTPTAANVTVFVVVRHNTLSVGDYHTIYSLAQAAAGGITSFFTGGANLWWTGPNDLLSMGNGFNNGGPRTGVTAANYGSSTTNFYHLQIELGSPLSVAQNGSALTTYDNTAGSVPSYTSKIFSLFFVDQGGFSAANWGAVDIAEIVICYDCTSGDKTNVNAYLTAQWGI